MRTDSNKDTASYHRSLALPEPFANLISTRSLLHCMRHCTFFCPSLAELSVTCNKLFRPFAGSQARSEESKRQQVLFFNIKNKKEKATQQKSPTRARVVFARSASLFAGLRRPASWAQRTSRSAARRGNLLASFGKELLPSVFFFFFFFNHY